MTECFNCRKKVKFFDLYGNITEPFKHYCKKCWFKRLAKESLQDYKEYLKEARAK